MAEQPDAMTELDAKHYSLFQIEAPSEGWVRLRDEEGELLF